MDPLTIGLIAGGTSLVQGLGTHFTNKANMREASRQRAWNQKMWNMQNAYNTPLAQKQRLEDAGLNTNLIYGSGSAQTGNAGSVMNYQKPNIDYRNALPDVLGLLQGIQQLKNMEIKNNNDLEKGLSYYYKNEYQRLYQGGWHPSTPFVSKYGLTKWRQDPSKSTDFGNLFGDITPMEKDLWETLRGKEYKNKLTRYNYSIDKVLPWNIRVMKLKDDALKNIGIFDYSASQLGKILNSLLPKSFRKYIDNSVTNRGTTQQRINLNQ
jgi:hypothetical protein